jgi:capsular polysaccharide transport system permease protein
MQIPKTHASTAETSKPARRAHLRSVGATEVPDEFVHEEIRSLRRRVKKLKARNKRQAVLKPLSRKRMWLWALWTLTPALLVFAYLHGAAHPQYYSYAGFTTRTSDAAGSADVLTSGLGFGIATQANENDILYSYIQSQELVASLDAALDLTSKFSAGWSSDPLLQLRPSATREDLHRHWLKVFDVAYDRTSGLIEMRLRGPDPVWVSDVLAAVIRSSTAKVNDINQAAFADAVQFAEIALQDAETAWQTAREVVQEFRVANGIVDPAVEIESRMGVLTSLQHQLATAMIELDEMAQTADRNDPRFRKLDDRVTVIRDRLAAERLSFSGDVPQNEKSFPELVSTYEALSTDLEFAQLRYTNALAALTRAQSDAAENSRYLAVYLEPTIAETSEFPMPFSTAALVALISTLISAIFAMVYLSVRGRR